jgi:VWFA-related protein
MLMRRGLLWIALSCFAVGSVFPQTADRPNPSNLTFKARTQIVVEDVVVTDRKGHPVDGLRKEDFQIFEEGKPQTIVSFEEHKGVSEHGLPPLPPNIFSNYPKPKPSDSVNVLLLDSLNTPLSDQSKVHLQLVSFLKSIPAGSHIAIFTLSSGLFMVQGFTSDPSILLAALNKKTETRPQSSALLGVGPVDNLDTDINKQLAVTGAGMESAMIASMEKLQQFQNQTENFQDRLRKTLTLQALQGLANFLTGVPGRKNVIWFSDSFPLSIISGRGLQNYESSSPEQAELRKTVNMLAAAQVAIYPISAMGLDQKFVSHESRVKSVAVDSVRTVQNQQIAEVTSPSWDTDEVLQHQDSREYGRQDAQLATMHQLAKDTGGEAFYYTNGMKEALARVISDGSHYYTISYSPTDEQADSRYRPIEVKLARGDYNLDYRHGYFAEEPAGKKAGKKEDVAPPARDPLQPFMIGGLPDATQIVYKVRVLPLPPPQPGSKAAGAGGRKGLKGPLTRYGLDFAVFLHDLKFKVAADGQHEDKIEIILAAYDQDGIPVNSMTKVYTLSLNPRLYATFEKTGVQLHEEIDVPKGGAYLRTGICDLATNRAGTLEVSLNQVDSSVVGAK